MIKVSVFWNDNSDQLADMLKYLNDTDEASVELIPAENQSGEGEEMMTSDLSALKGIAESFGCRVVDE